MSNNDIEGDGRIILAAISERDARSRECTGRVNFTTIEFNMSTPSWQRKISARRQSSTNLTARYTPKSN